MLAIVHCLSLHVCLFDCLLLQGQMFALVQIVARLLLYCVDRKKWFLALACRSFGPECGLVLGNFRPRLARLYLYIVSEEKFSYVVASKSVFKAMRRRLFTKALASNSRIPASRSHFPHKQVSIYPCCEEVTKHFCKVPTKLPTTKREEVVRVQDTCSPFVNHP